MSLVAVTNNLTLIFMTDISALTLKVNSFSKTPLSGFYLQYV